MTAHTQRKPWHFDGTQPGPGRPKGSHNKPKTLAAALTQLIKQLKDKEQ